jgi:hypothetical protein
LAEGEHGIADIKAGHVSGGADRLSHFGGQQARSRADIQHALPRAKAKRPEGGVSLLNDVRG